MSVKASLLRRAALVVLAGIAIATPVGARASLLDGLSLRIGFFHPSRDGVRDITDFAMWGAGIEYKLPWVPRVFNGDHWSTSISADIHYTQRVAGIARFIPISINQVYTFDEQNGHAPYAGFCVTAATFGTTGVRTASTESGTMSTPTVTRFGGGLIIGTTLTYKLYVEARYEWFDQHNVAATPEGFRAYVGWHF